MKRRENKMSILRKRAGLAFFLARKNIAHSKKTVFLTLLIISLGFVSGVIIPGVLVDVTTKMQEKFITTYLGHIIIEPLDNHAYVENAYAIKNKIESLPEVKAVLVSQSIVANLKDSGGNSINRELLIVNPEEQEEFSVVSNSIKDGEFLSSGAGNKLLFGCLVVKSCAKTDVMGVIDVDVGQKVKVTFNKYGEKDFIVQGIYGTGFQDTEQMIFMSQKTAEMNFPDFNKNNATVIRVLLYDQVDTKKVLQEISQMGINAKISDWQEKLAFMADITNSFGVIGTFSFFMGILISSISVYIILYINIINKKVQIGIIKAVGIDSGVISWSYIIQAIFLGIFGAIFGALLTFGIVTYFSFFPIVTPMGMLVPAISTSTYLLISVVIVFASTITGYLVSRKIIKQNILDSILKG